MGLIGDDLVDDLLDILGDAEKVGIASSADSGDAGTLYVHGIWRVISWSE